VRPVMFSLSQSIKDDSRAVSGPANGIVGEGQAGFLGGAAAAAARSISN